MEARATADGLRRRLADQVTAARLPLGDLPLWERVTHCAVDWIGVAVASTGTPVARILHQVAPRVRASPASGRAALVLGRATRSAPSWAARVNGAIGHAQDFDDTHIDSGVHVSSAILPALLAALPEHEVSGADLLEAYAAGIWVCEVLSVEDAGPRLLREGLHPTATLGAIAAAAAVTRLWQLGPRQADAAIGLASSSAYGTVASFGSLAKPLQAGGAAANGLLAASLARSGITAGAWSDTTAAGPVLRLLLPDADTIERAIRTLDGAAAPRSLRAAVFNTAHKPYATCLYTHSAIDTAIRLRTEIEESDLADVCAVTVGASREGIVSASIPEPATGDAGKFSIAYCVAVALARGEAPLDAFTANFGRDEAANRLMSTITVEERDHLRRFEVEVEVVLADGSRLVRTAVTSRGSPRTPMSTTEIVEKFLQNLHVPFGLARADDALRLAQGLQSSTDVAADLDALWSLLWPDTPETERDA